VKLARFGVRRIVCSALTLSSGSALFATLSRLSIWYFSLASNGFSLSSITPTGQPQKTTITATTNKRANKQTAINNSNNNRSSSSNSNSNNNNNNNNDDDDDDDTIISSII
jgi:hypothetical protein